MSFLYTWGTRKFLCVIGMVRGTPELWEWSSSSLFTWSKRQNAGGLHEYPNFSLYSVPLCLFLLLNFFPTPSLQAGFWVTDSKAGGIPLFIQMHSGKNRWSPCRNATSSLQYWEVQPAQLQWGLFVPGWLYPSLAFGSRWKLYKPLQ